MAKNNYRKTKCSNINSACNILINYLKSNKVLAARYLYPKKDLTPKSFLAPHIESFLKIELDKNNWKERTTEKNRGITKRFDEFLIAEKQSELNERIIINFITSLNSSPINQDQIAKFLKRFFSFLYEEGITDKNFSKAVPPTRRKRNDKIPSFYSEDEIKRVLMIAKEGLGKRSGRRNYALLTLAAGLGMRSGDIKNLQFKDIDWKANEINIIQLKTEESLKLPLLPVVGNAIIDYIQNERKSSESKFIFLGSHPPYNPLNVSRAICYIAEKAFLEAGIDILNRKKGFHSMRHSIASELLGQKTDLPKISQALGHSSTSSTTVYLRIDTKTLKDCALPISIVSDNFYNQKYGKFFAKF